MRFASVRRTLLFLLLLVLPIGAGGMYHNFVGNVADAKVIRSAAVHLEKLVITGKDGNSHTFDVEIAKTEADKEVGLMFRETMPATQGMLFEMGRPPQAYSFWMKNTLIPLDMLFVDENGVIAAIHENTEPKSLTSHPSGVPVIAVLEINGGLCAKLGIRAGDTVSHPYFVE